MLIWRIAQRYLFSRKSHNAVNIISLVALVGVAVSTTAMVCVLSVFNGFSDIAASRLSILDPEYAIERGGGIFDGDALADSLRTAGQIGGAVSVLEQQGLAVYGDRQMAVRLIGVGEGWGEIVDIDKGIVDGVNAVGRVGGDATATLSAGVAIKLGAHPYSGVPIEIYVPRRKGRVNVANPAGAFLSDTLNVDAVYQIQQQEYDADVVYLPIERLRALSEYDGGEATMVGVKGNPGRVEGYEVKDRLGQQETSFRMIAVEKWISFLMLVFILLIASFNIISTMSMLIIEKEESIGILRALGAGRRMIDGIFVLESWLISFGGGVAGVVCGTILTLIQQYGGVLKLGGDHSRMSMIAYPARLDIVDLCVVLGIVALTGLVTGLIVPRLRRTAGH